MRSFISLILFALLAGFAQAESRIALLIGNEDYPSEVGRLSLPHQDVATLSAALRVVGFDVTEGLDLDEDGMDDAFSAFERQIDAAADRGEEVVAFLYYSGHGASALIDGSRSNYLLPARENISTASELVRKGIELDEAVRGLSLTRAKAVFVVTDACRNDLVSAFDRSGSKGFTPAVARAGMFIAHSTYPGAVAPDDGAFATTLARYLNEPGIEAARAFQLANREVAQGRGVTQIPTTANALTDDFYFMGRSTSDAPAMLIANDEGTALAQAISANTLAAFEAFKTKFSSSAHMEFVDDKIRRLSASSALTNAAASSSPSVDWRSNLLGTWRGWHDCGRLADIEVQFNAVDGDVVRGVRYFTTETRGSKQGSFYVEATRDPSSGATRIVSGDWIYRPPGYGQCDLIGDSDAGDRIIGDSPNCACGAFLLEKQF